MDRRDVQSGIIRAWNVVDSLALGETISSPVPLPVNEEFRDVVLSGESTYVSIYLTGLGLSHYNFLMTDYSFFQFSWTSPDHVRYAYYPNPFVVGEDNLSEIRQWRELLENGSITLEDYLSILRDAQSGIGVPPVRYESAPDQHKGLQHPSSHFHIGHHQDNRWAINRTITPLAFTLLILKHYYGPAWREMGTDEQDEFGNRFEAQLIREKMNCRLIGDVLFLPAEARSFFFS
jgi:hypothetical protein